MTSFIAFPNIFRYPYIEGKVEVIPKISEWIGGWKEYFQVTLHDDVSIQRILLSSFLSLSCED